MEAAIRRRTLPEEEPYNLSLGPTRYRLRTELVTEFNDNVNFAQIDRQSDLILTPKVSLEGAWKLSRLNTLRVNVGLGYRHYLNGSVDRADSGNFLLIEPDSNLSFDLFVDDRVRITLHDYFFQSNDPTEQANLSNVSTYARIENKAGVTLLWDLNSVVLTTNYDHFTYISLTDAFNYLDHTTEILQETVAVYLSEATRAGADATIAFSSYSETYQNDSMFLNLGPFIERKMSPFTTLRLQLGPQVAKFSRGGGNGDNSDFTGWTGNFTLINRFHHYCTQTLAAGRECQPGLRTNFEQVDYLRYSLIVKGIREFPTSLYVFYEHVSESGENLPETMSRYGSGVRVSHPLGKQASMSLDYQFLLKDSDLPMRNYRQNRVFCTLSYQF